MDGKLNMMNNRRLKEGVLAQPQKPNIVFMCGDIEMIKLELNGDIFVKGKLIKNDIEVVNGLREFLNYHKHIT